MNVNHFFRPKSVAIIGASRDPGKVGYAVLDNLRKLEYSGKIYAVNPKTPEILGMKTVPSIGDIKGKIDLAVFVIPPNIILKQIEQFGDRFDSAVVISAGFKEVNKEGAEMEKELKRFTDSKGITVLGPNCLGLINTHAKLNASFSATVPIQGNISFFSQSGALCTAVLDWAEKEKIGFSKFISIGNKMDLNELDILEMLGNDPETKVILGYLEGVSDGRKFIELARKVSAKKPVIISKGGGTEAGRRAASSHTGTLAGSERAYDAAFTQAGVIRAMSVEELFDYAIAFSYQDIPEGNKVAVVTNAGGPGIICADAVERSDLKIAEFSKETVEGLKKVLPPAAALYNPVDVIGDARDDRYANALNVIIKDKSVDALIILLTPQAMSNVADIAKAIAKISKKTKKPVVTAFMGGHTVDPGIKILREKGIPNYAYPERAVKSVEAMIKYKELRDRRKKSTGAKFSVDKKRVKEILKKCREEGQTSVPESVARNVLLAYGFDMPESVLCTSSDEAVKAAQRIGYPVVMKVASYDISHKSDVGGVKVDVKDSDDVRKQFHEIVSKSKKAVPGADIQGVLVQKMITKGKEIILGMSRDPQFGPLVMFGLGGIYVEVLKDVSFRVAPFSREDAAEMIRETKMFPILRGVRGDKSTDLDGIVDALLRLGALVTDFPEIVELDINPVKALSVDEKGTIALDARLTLKSGE